MNIDEIITLIRDDGIEPSDEWLEALIAEIERLREIVGQQEDIVPRVFDAGFITGNQLAALSHAAEAAQAGASPPPAVSPGRTVLPTEENSPPP